MVKTTSKKPEQEGKSNPGNAAVGDAPVAAPQKIDLSLPAIKDAISKGQSAIKEGKSKADAARLIFGLLQGEAKEVIVAAFVSGANLTDKGALTYWYNCKRKQEK